MNNDTLNKIKAMAQDATSKPWSEQNVADLDVCYNTLQEIIDLVDEHEYQTRVKAEREDVGATIRANLDAMDQAYSAFCRATADLVEEGQR